MSQAIEKPPEKIATGSSLPRKLLYALLVAAAIAAGLYGFVSWRFDAIAEAMIFPWAKPETLSIEPESAKADIRALRIPTGVGEISALVLPSAREPRRAILYTHGNGERLSYVQTEMRTLNDMGYTVISYDYPGYGESGGRADIDSFRRAAESMADYVRDTLGFAPEQTVYGGYSLGTAAAMLSATHMPPAKIFLLAPFSSDRELARSYAGFDLYGLFGHEALLSNVDPARNIRVPVLVAHGRVDRTVPYSAGEAVFAAVASDEKTFVTLGEDTGHFFEIAKEEALYERLKLFLE